MKTRLDARGLFWDNPVKEVPKKAVAPERVWERPDFLPYFKEAKAFNVSLFTTEELIQAHSRREMLVCDTEVYINYTLIAFASLTTGKIIYFETSTCLTEHERHQLDWILHNFKIITFNGISFDLAIMALALAGLNTETIKHASSKIINEEIKSWLVLRSHKVESLKIDHIDLIEVAPLSASLKIYGGRLHVPKMQELPFPHHIILSPDQIAVVRWYCINSDLTATCFLYQELEPQIKLRQSMSIMYGRDLCSKSDAQIAEAVISAELSRMGICAERTLIEPGTTFKYQVPSYLKFFTPRMQEVLQLVADADFIIDESGAPILPKEIGDIKVELGNSVYQMGIGGLHSCEKCVGHYTNDFHKIYDFDVQSYYPAIILNQELYPKHLGRPFLEVFRSIVTRRLAAKKSGNKVEADSLKIVANSTYGKMGSKWSPLYAPDLLIQVTMSGQLSLLMLIEHLELNGISVVSANTDGVVIKAEGSQVVHMKEIVAEWEKVTGFITEENQYCFILSKDISNYCALDVNGKLKTKGTFGDVTLSKNPTNLICRDALISFLTTGTPISTTIRSCKDIRRFVSVRTVKGGAVKDGQYLGKAIRWYQSNVVTGDIIYALNGNKVPNSENCRPCMELPAALPDDVDFGRYEAQTYEMLKEIGYK